MGSEFYLRSEELMQTNWVPREAQVYTLDIPANLDFLANIMCEDMQDSRRIVRPMFYEKLSNAEQFRNHQGIFRMSVVVVSDNAATVERIIQARFNGNPLGLFAEA